MKPAANLVAIAIALTSVATLAATPPYVQIVDAPTQLATTCGPASVAPRVSVNINLPAGTIASYWISHMELMPYMDYYNQIQYVPTPVPVYMPPTASGPVVNSNGLFNVDTPAAWFRPTSDPDHVESVAQHTQMVLSIITANPDDGTGTYASSANVTWDCTTGVVLAITNMDNAGGGAPATVAKTKVVEFYNASLDHYFVTAAAAEIAALDSGQTVGWRRTGADFGAFPASVTAASPVCRFYIPPALGDSHFYSASAAECAAVASKFPGFTLESSAAFYVILPDANTGECPPTTAPVYRLWNRRADSNHRYTTDLVVRAQMIAAGYAPEGYGTFGVSMCAPM